MLAGLVERRDSSQPTRMNGVFMPTDSSGRRSPLHFMTTKMARRVRWHSQITSMAATEAVRKLRGARGGC